MSIHQISSSRKDPQRPAQEVIRLVRAGGRFESLEAYCACIAEYLGPERSIARTNLVAEYLRRTQKQGATLPEVDLVFAPLFPLHTAVDPRIIRHVNFAESERIRGERVVILDEVCDEICREIAKRLPRSLEAHLFSFRQRFFSLKVALAYREGARQCAEAELEVEGLGRLELGLIQQGKGVFTGVHSVSGPGFRFSNHRRCGREVRRQTQAGEWVVFDEGWPSDIKISRLDLGLSLYGGVRVQTFGMQYSNRGRDDDSLLLEKEGLANSNDPKIVGIFDSVAKALRLGNRRDAIRQILDDERSYESLLRKLKIPHGISFSAAAGRAAEWLIENVLAPIRAMPPVKSQVTRRHSPPYPKQQGDLFCWLPRRDAASLGSGASRGEFFKSGPILPDTPIAFRDTSSLGTPLWRLCGFLKGREAENPDSLNIPGGSLSPAVLREFLDQGREPRSLSAINPIVLVRITPRSARDIYVVETAVTQPGCTELKRETLVPIGDYQGDYVNPVVLIGRDLMPEEVHLMPGKEFDVFEGHVDERGEVRRRAPMRQINNLPAKEFEIWKKVRATFIQVGERIRKGEAVASADVQGLIQRGCSEFEPVLQAILTRTLKSLRRIEEDFEGTDRHTEGLERFQRVKAYAGCVGKFYAHVYLLCPEVERCGVSDAALITAFERLSESDSWEQFERLPPYLRSISASAAPLVSLVRGASAGVVDSFEPIDPVYCQWIGQLLGGVIDGGCCGELAGQRLMETLKGTLPEAQLLSSIRQGVAELFP